MAAPARRRRCHPNGGAPTGTDGGAAARGRAAPRRQARRRRRLGIRRPRALRGHLWQAARRGQAATGGGALGRRGGGRGAERDIRSARVRHALVADAASFLPLATARQARQTASWSHCLAQRRLAPRKKFAFKNRKRSPRRPPPPAIARPRAPPPPPRSRPPPGAPPLRGAARRRCNARRWWAAAARRRRRRKRW